MNELVKKLKKEAETNDCAKAVFLMWALRERARREVTVNTLSVSMTKQGFFYPVNRYRDLLKTLASFNLGKLKLDSKGKVVALIDVTARLQSVGKSAISQTPVRLERMQPPPSKYKNVVAAPPTPAASQPPTTSVSKSTIQKDNRIIKGRLILTVMLGENKSINIQVPPNLSDEEIVALFSGFQKGAVS